jgi:predicted nucleotidyltransferase
MSLELLELGASALGEIAEEVVFVGGATVTLWITDPAAPPPRPTKDVDVIVEVATRAEYHAFEQRLRDAGFRGDSEVICRWHKRESALVLDAMPTDAAVLGFENEWQREAFPHAVDVSLPSGLRIGAVPPPFLLATKLEAYLGRGEGDLLGSADFADIVALVDGREELLAETRAGPKQLRAYVAATLEQMLADERVLDGVRAQLLPDAASQARSDLVVARLRELTSIEAE